MIIICPCGKKKFNVDSSAIPADGRLLKCGTCSEVWHYKIPTSEQNILEELNNIENQKTEITEKNIDEVIKKEEIISPNTNNAKSKRRKIKDKNESKSKELVSIEKNTEIKENKIIKNIFLTLISLIAFILLIDTFKNQISQVFPGIINISDSLYLVINDLKLFIKDLLR
tara:strand:- start:6 stop:515 length:510 start_codon:yes stop_codon:yes gene_type:complete